MKKNASNEVKIIEILKVFSISVILVIIGCTTINKPADSNASLELRVKNFYGLMQRKAYNKSYYYYDSGIFSSEIEFVNAAKKFTKTIVSYQIEKIQIDNNKAKVSMQTILAEKTIKNSVKSFDNWILKNGTWYLRDFGKAVGKKTVEEFDYDKHFPPKN